ncbi:hypothetical protein [Amycolatopsis sp. NPDC051371]|uniref:hypothetical protein n=1 Tax=Amycolatopsis sp. NPDC051371 TaxID=3155800 RepID=UPI0034257154
MTYRPQSSDGRPRHRGDSTRPPRRRRGGDLAPYPGAHSTTTGAAGTRATARPGGRPPRSHRRTSSGSPDPIPATVWTCGPDPIDAHESWPVPIVERITSVFTTVGGHVVLVDAGTATPASATPETPDATATGGVIPAPVQEAVRALGRTVNAVALDTRADVAVTSSRPFWADLVGDSTASTADPATDAVGDPALGGCGAVDSGQQRADVVLVALPAQVVERVSLDRLALRAAAVVRRGGIVAVYTHSDGNGERLLDPTGAIVAAAQHADLLYLQHIVVLHTPVRAGGLHAVPSASVAAEYDRTARHATVRGLPAPHLRAHADILVFAQPADPTTGPPSTPDIAPAPADDIARGDRQ